MKVHIFETRDEMGAAATKSVTEKIQDLLKQQDQIRMIFAAAPSQNEFLDYFSKRDIEWDRITAFHMDEYIGIDTGAPQRFGNFLKERLFDKVPFGEVHFIDPTFTDSTAECQRYEHLLRKAPIDIVCMGIGENGHIAFNDPPVADFNDPVWVKVVELDRASRQQQVNDECFSSIADVPTHAVTLTIPALISAHMVLVVVPGSRKADAVQKTLLGAISEECPASILRNHSQAYLFLDKYSAAKIN